MTLFKQMAIAISIIIIIMLAAVMAINYQSAKKDMIQSLYETTVNNISTLTSQLADASSDSAFLVTTIDSEFDSGYYKMIDFKSNDGKSDYMQIDNSPVADVPLWFVNFTGIKLEPVSADVSSGWDMIGTVSVLSDTGVVYRALYKMFIKLSYLFVIFVFLSLVALYVMLYFILKPLYRVQNQAEAILRNEFIIQKEVPYTTEFKDVVFGMNAMVNKVEEIFKKGNEAAQRNKELLYNDPTTKLFNMRYLKLKLSDLIKLENKTNGGTIMFVSLEGVGVINQLLGGRTVDDIFVQIAEIFTKITNDLEDKVLVRERTEFTLMLPDCDSSKAIKIANTIDEQLSEIIKKYDLDAKNVYISLGLYQYKPNIGMGGLLTSADNALTMAKASESTNIHLYEDKNEDNAMGKEQWRHIIEESIDKNYFSLKFWPTLNANTKNVNHKVMTFTIDGGENKKYFYGDFIAPAINLGLVSKMYLVALKDLITSRHEELHGANCSIRLSNEFIKDTQAFNELSLLFSKYAKSLNFKLSFEVSDTFAINNTIAVKAYVDLFAKYGFKFGINSFTGESSDFAYLKELNPEFLKADCAFLLDQSQDSMSALQVITDSLGIEIVATFVKNQEELDTLLEMHISSVQGPVTDTIS